MHNFRNGSLNGHQNNFVITSFFKYLKLLIWIKKITLVLYLNMLYLS